MSHTLTSVLEFALLALTSVFFLVDPFAVIPVFLAITEGSPDSERRMMARRSAWTCAIVLCTFSFAGSLIFKAFGITLPAFKIAGGIILLQIGLDMLQARQSSTKSTPEETEEGVAKADASIIPLGMPMLAGPGAISNVVVLTGQASHWWETVTVYVAIALTALASYFFLAGADRVRKRMSETAIHILTRIMGILITALAVQFIATGAKALGLLPVGR